LGRPLDDDRIARNRSDLLGIELSANGKHQLHIFVFCGRAGNAAEDIHPAIHYRAH
jgi:hypothetical protein